MLVLLGVGRYRCTRDTALSESRSPRLSQPTHNECSEQELGPSMFIGVRRAENPGNRGLCEQTGGVWFG